MVLQATGKVKFFLEEKGFGFIAVEGMSDIFFHITDLGDHRSSVVAGSMVSCIYEREYRAGTWKHTLRRVVSVVAPATGPERHEGWALVAWYNKTKGLGFAIMGEGPVAGEQAVLFASVCEKAGIIPAKDMPMKAIVEKGEKGWKVVSFQAGPEITAEAMRAPAQSADTDEPIATPVSTDLKPPKKKAVRAKIVRTAAVPDTAIAAAFAKALEEGQGSMAAH